MPDLNITVRTGLRRARCFWLGAAALLLTMPAPLAFAAKDGVVTIPLGPLGYPVRQQSKAMAANAIYTLNYVDNSHILFTYTMHELLRRIPNDPEEDEDRNVAAVLLEVPSGKVVAQTVWRLHDYSQYLWDLGGGRFMLRTRNAMTTIAPLETPAEPFLQQPLIALEDDVAIANIDVTQDRGVLVLEVSEKPKPQTGSAAAMTRQRETPPVQVQFVRLLPSEGPGTAVKLRRDAEVVRRYPTAFSLTSKGFMQVLREGSYKWGFDYRQYDGTQKRLAGLESTCQPFPVFVSGSEFVTFGCRGSEDKSSLTGYSLSGEIAWQMSFSQAQAYSSLSAAPAAGRFAISRSTAMGFGAPRMPSMINEQEVRVIQTYNGKQLLRVTTSPIQASGQNFAMSPDGMSVAVMQDAIVIYKLPDLGDADRKAVAAAKALEPKDAPDLRVDLTAGAPEMPSQPPMPTMGEAATMGEPPIDPGPSKAILIPRKSVGGDVPPPISLFVPGGGAGADDTPAPAVSEGQTANAAPAGGVVPGAPVAGGIPSAPAPVGNLPRNTVPQTTETADGEAPASTKKVGDVAPAKAPGPPEAPAKPPSLLTP